MMPSYSYDAIEERLVQLLKEVTGSFTTDEAKEVSDFINVGEYGLALQTLIDIVLEEKKRISPCALQIIEELVMVMGIATEVDLIAVRKSID
jgi:hypothetical protein